MINLKNILLEAGKLADKKVKYKSKDGESKEMEYKSAVRMPKEHPAKIAALKMKPDEKGGKEKEKVKGADMFKTKEKPKSGKPKGTTDAPSEQAPKSIALKKGLPPDLKQSMSKISSQDDLKKMFPNAELIQDTKETHQFFKLGMESEGRGGKKHPIYAKAYINRKTGEMKMSNVYSGKRRDFGGGFTQGSDTIDPNADSVLKDKPKDKPLSKKEKSPYGAKQKGIGAGFDNLKGPTDDANSISGDAEAERKLLGKLKNITKENDVDLCTISVPGTNLFCTDNKQVPRDEMPQLKSKVVPGGKADKLVKAGKLEIDPLNGEVNTEPLFKDMLEKEGISMGDPTPKKVTELKATQNQLVGSKVNMFAKVLAGDKPFDISDEDFQKFQDILREPLIISKDGYILDGHHRWAALVQHDIANGGTGDVEIDTKEVDLGAEDLVEKTNKFTNDMGLAIKSAKKKPKKENFESQMLSKINEMENCCG